MDIIGNAGTPEFLLGTEQNDRILGQPDDLIASLGGDDILAGAGRMYGGTGNDTYYIQQSGTGQQVVEYADQGTDTAILMLDPGSGHYTLPDNVENGVIVSGSTLFDNDMDNTLFGNDATNFLVGGGGNDVLAPGYGADYMVGGAGNDTFTITNGDSLQFNGDVITDWNKGDTINLMTSGQAWDFVGNGNFHPSGDAEIRTDITQDHMATLVQFDQNGDGVVDSTL